MTVAIKNVINAYIMSLPGTMLLAGIAFALPGHALAEDATPDSLASCRTSITTEKLPPLGAAGTDTRIQADSSSGTLTEWLLQGNVLIEKDENRLLADQVTYFSESGRAILQGNVVIQQPDLTITGDSGELHINSHAGEIHSSRYELPLRAGWGHADAIHVLDPQHTAMTNITYSTCLPDRKDWELQADRIELDQEQSIGRAKGVVMRFKDVPVFYVPRMSFALDDSRKSGFLVPGLGHDDDSGTIVTIPYYWNIAPNRDATITPRHFARRGTQLGLEYRYLHENGKGILAGEYLPDDELTHDDRGVFSYQHSSRYAGNWSLNANLNHASDRNYFEDLSSNLILSSITNLEQRVDLGWRRNSWRLLARVQAFQPVGDTSETYRRLPQLLLDGTPTARSGELEFPLHAELVRFDHENNVTTGRRYDIYPAIRYDYRQPAYFLTPKLGLRHTRYDTVDPAGRLPDSQSRTVPIASLDSGLFFEKQAQVFGRNVVHSLEPRLYYLYVPFRDQDDLPVYDTGLYTFTFAQMFRENRFTGPDRQVDANQLSVALTHRTLDTETGDEILRLGLGQILYFRDREVTLPNRAVATLSRSELVAEVGMQIGRHTNAAAAAVWDPEAEQTTRSSIRMQYRSDNRHILNLSYRFEQDDFEQTDLSFIWQLSHNWAGIGQWNYALDDERTQNALLGLQYETCCWLFRIVGRSYLLDEDEDRNNSVFLQIQFKGLGNFGNRVEELLERTIFGYRDDEGVQ